MDPLDKELEILEAAARSLLAKNSKDRELANQVNQMLSSFRELQQANANRELPKWPAGNSTEAQRNDFNNASNNVAKLFEEQNKQMIGMVQDSRKLLSSLSSSVISPQDRKAALEDVSLVTEVNKVSTQVIKSPQNVNFDRLGKLQEKAQDNVKNADKRYSDKKSAAFSKKLNSSIASEIAMFGLAMTCVLALITAVVMPPAAPLAAVIAMSAMKVLVAAITIGGTVAEVAEGKKGLKQEAQADNIKGLQETRKSTMLYAKDLHGKATQARDPSTAPAASPTGPPVVPPRRNR